MQDDILTYLTTTAAPVRGPGPGQAAYLAQWGEVTRLMADDGLPFGDAWLLAYERLPLGTQRSIKRLALRDMARVVAEVAR